MGNKYVPIYSLYGFARYVTLSPKITYFGSRQSILNHVRFADPTLSLANPSTFGVITRSAAGSTTIPLYTPRQLEFGVRVHF
ncbi:MAG: hypothetical protein DMG48_19850 [Acidobacteria bacterium]|nr:MAG: hypothetical protein DMG48_19850 [Acidobacteriota bacterium]